MNEFFRLILVLIAFIAVFTAGWAYGYVDGSRRAKNPPSIYLAPGTYRILSDDSLTPTPLGTFEKLPEDQ